MKVGLSLVLVVLSALLVGAHFLRSGQYVGIGVSILAPALLFVRRAWAIRVVQGGLLAAAGLWVATAAQVASIRMQGDRPWVRMAVILGVVALVAVAGAVLLQARAVRDTLAPASRARQRT